MMSHRWYCRVALVAETVVAPVRNTSSLRCTCLGRKARSEREEKAPAPMPLPPEMKPGLPTTEDCWKGTRKG